MLRPNLSGPSLAQSEAFCSSCRLNVPVLAEAIITQLRGKHAELCLDKGPSLGPKLTKSILATPCGENSASGSRLLHVEKLVLDRFCSK